MPVAEVGAGAARGATLRRLVDLAVVVPLLVLLAPAMALIALLVRRDSPGPVLYVPAMVGQGGRLFPLLRFRTMRPGSSGATPEARLTRVGRVLRNSSLDHLPMLLNVLFGDMTLVGPRPMELAVVDLRDPTWRAYVRAKPGVVSSAVVRLGSGWTPSRSARPELNQRLELEYAARRGAWSDARLFGRGLMELLRSRGNLKARKPPDPDVAP
jgi:lipopolysaccharide/colanic/teichoic acid biosynthesis glycosyltransferase